MNDNVRDMSDVFWEYGTTTFHPLTAVFMLCMVGLVLSSRRSRVVLAILLVCVFMPTMQRVVIGGLDFNMLRLITLAAWIRVLIRREYRGIVPGKIDYIFILWTISLAIIHVARVGPSGIVYRLGTSFDALAVFFLFRVLIRRREDVFLVSRQLAWAVIPLAGFFIYEMVTQINVFAIFGGAETFSAARDGRTRCQGPFSHAILAGTFGAVLVPIFVGLFRGQKKGRALFGSAILSTTMITVASGSSGPLIAWGVGVIGWGLWRLRKQMRLILWTATGLAAFIHLMREKPIWHLIGRLASVTGGTGYHRYLLIDAFLTRFGEWALVGTSGTAYWGWGLQDVTNQYVAEGVNGGLLTLVLFLALLVACFSRLRLTREATERAEGPKSLWVMLTWGFSVSLTAHCVAFISVSYFGQMQQFFYLFLGLIPALTRHKRRARQAASHPPTQPAPQARPVGQRYQT